eukprot:TRINITY_DN22024_c0_g1_i2.p1 TRINITY_DN22024_c0_g1~~TRINITY_DN22024_c0_g1_i2.p1  ORF type:complete len:490 (-),score=74.92 TRINITY_DN22024_c0_g1_i2:384-1853(-)
MGENSLDLEDESCSSARAPGSGSLRKEPSFSRWCLDADGNYTFTDHSSDSTEEAFELPLLSQDQVNEKNDHLDQDTNTSASSFGNYDRSFSASCYSNKDGDCLNRKPYSSLEIHLNERIESGLQVSGAPSSSVTPLVIRALSYILLWYTFSTCLTLYNKLLLGAKMGSYSLLGEKMGKFPAPLLMNAIHFSMQGIVSSLVLRFWYPNMRPCYMEWKDYFFRVVPTAVATALDVDLSNASLVFITVTFATMCKSSAPVFLLIFAFLFKLESPNIKLVGIILIISFGVLLTVAKSTEFNFWGFLFVMLAALMSGLRWTLTQMLLQKEEYGLTNPFATMSYIAPVMALITAVFSLISEPWLSLTKTRYFDTPQHIFGSCLLMLLGGTLAFFMVLCEYLLVSATSAVTFTVAGIVKEVVTIVVAIFFFHDQFTVLKGIGLLVIIFGVTLFNWYKYQKIKDNGANGYTKAEHSNQHAKYVILDDLEEDAKSLTV